MKARDLIKEFKREKLGPFIEVPCSILTSLIRELMADPQCEVLNPVNEAIAMGMAAGTYLATRKIPVVLMQNSGLCNTLNALTSLNQIYRLPALYIITWRGNPEIKDAPEHEIMGAKLEDILRTFDIPYAVLSRDKYREQVTKLIRQIRTSGSPAALVLKSNIIECPHDKEGTPGAPEKQFKNRLTRADALRQILGTFGPQAAYVTTNGFISRDAFHTAAARPDIRHPIFYMLGSMGHALPLGLGLSFSNQKGKRTVVIDGDGGVLMHLGAMTSIGSIRKRSKQGLVYIILDNRLYASTGGQPTVSGSINFCKIAEACGFDHVFNAGSKKELEKSLDRALRLKGFVFIHATITEAKHSPSPRVSSLFSCNSIKENFMFDLGRSGTRSGN